jgi:hypothetical protein
MSAYRRASTRSRFTDCLSRSPGSPVVTGRLLRESPNGRRISVLAICLSSSKAHSEIRKSRSGVGRHGLEDILAWWVPKPPYHGLLRLSVPKIPYHAVP